MALKTLITRCYHSVLLLWYKKTKLILRDNLMIFVILELEFQANRFFKPVSAE